MLCGVGGWRCGRQLDSLLQENLAHRFVAGGRPTGARPAEGQVGQFEAVWLGASCRRAALSRGVFPARRRPSPSARLSALSRRRSTRREPPAGCRLRCGAATPRRTHRLSRLRSLGRDPDEHCRHCTPETLYERRGGCTANEGGGCSRRHRGDAVRGGRGRPCVIVPAACCRRARDDGPTDGREDRRTDGTESCLQPYPGRALALP